MCDTCPPDDTPDVTIDPPPTCIGEACVEIWSTDCITYDGTASTVFSIVAGERLTATIEHLIAGIPIYDVTHSVTVTAGTGTLNSKSGLIIYTPGGVVTSGSSDSITITNSSCLATSIVLATISLNGNSQTVVIKSIVANAGNFVVTITNVSATDYSGSIRFRFIIL